MHRSIKPEGYFELAAQPAFISDVINRVDAFKEARHSCIASSVGAYLDQGGRNFAFLDTKDRVNAITVAMNHVDECIIRDITFAMPGDDDRRVTIVEDLNISFLDLKGAKDLSKGDIADAFAYWGEIYLGTPVRGRDETQQESGARERSRDRESNHSGSSL